MKSYIHIRDVSRGELASLERGQLGENYHLSPDQGIAIRDVVGTICRHMGVAFDDATASTAERLGQDAAYVIDSSKARQTLGWRPEITMDQGLAEVVGWVEEYWDEIQRQALVYLHKA